jgi:predicted DNA-binding WGR domain protein
MPRYEFSEGSSNKFWEIELDGTSFTTTYGRIGTEGQTSLKEFDSEEAAAREYEKLVAEKVKKGYALAGSAPAAVTVAGKKTPVFDDEGDEDDEPTSRGRPMNLPSNPAEVAKPAKPAAASGSSKSGDAGARYFELVDGKSSKFWEIALDGASFTTRYGRIGTDGQQSLKEYGSDEQARREYEKLVAEKTKKGYVEK